MTMLRIPGMLLIGSAGPNTGKTLFASALIKKFSKTHDIIGIKVTTIKKMDGTCPRGGEGCGVCASLEGNFSITEETDSDSGKDTSRLLAAGASRVLWLRTLKSSLPEAAAALLDVIGPDSISICESNSLRLAAEPGAFLMLKHYNSNRYKAQAVAVAKYADRLISFNDTGFDLSPEQISLIDGKWAVPVPATAIIMAGGPSSRMGTDKAMLPINGRPLIAHLYNQLRPHFEQILISTNPTQQHKYAFLGADVITDRIPGQGPLMGIVSALQASANELNFVVACDIPQADISFVKKMLIEAEQYDVVIPTTGPSRYEPLFAVYKKSSLRAMNDVLAEGRRKIIDIFSKCKVKFINLHDAQWYVNLNTRVDYEKYESKHSDKI